MQPGTIRIRPRRKKRRTPRGWGSLIKGLATERSPSRRARIATRLRRKFARTFSWRRGLIGLGILCLLALIAVGARTIYIRVQRERTVQKARLFLNIKNYNESAFWLQRALQLNPTNPEAYRIGAELGEATGSPFCLTLWRRLTELQPGVPKNYFSWARAALRFHENEMAEQALGFVDAAGQNTATYHDLQAGLAEALNDGAKAEAELRKALEMDPANEGYELRLAALHLKSQDPKVHDSARALVEKLSAKPEFYRPASQALIQDDLARGRGEDVLVRARDLAQAPEAPFEDRIFYLGLLKRFHEANFSSYLSAIQSAALESPTRVSAVLNWFNAQGMGLVAIDWYKNLPLALRTASPVPATIAQSYASLREWKSVKKLVVGTNWENLEFSRLAFLARVLREEGDGRGSNERWSAAVKVAGDRPEALAILARTAFAWKWEKEGTAVLWTAAQRASNQQWALRALHRFYLQKGNTLGLLRVASRTLELDPHDIIAENGVAYYSLLLNANSQRVQELARHAYGAEPQNPATVATYALALYRSGKSKEGLAVMKSLGKEKLEDPSFALYYGILLAANGSFERRRTLSRYGRSRTHGPEEKTLLADARAKISQRRGDATPVTPPLPR